MASVDSVQSYQDDTLKASEAACAFSSFSRELVGDYVTISSDGLSAEIDDPTGVGEYGVVFSNAPLQMFDGEAYFEVRVDKASTEYQDGLTLGVTRFPPRDVLRGPPGYADDCLILGA